jgi:large subunit ribosomal protein L15
MHLNNLPKVKEKSKKRLGQGHGSGRVKTAGRGTKGQKARNKVPIYFEGGALPLIKRLPFLRGKDRNNSFQQTPVIVNLEALNNLKKNTIIDEEFLVANKFIKTQGEAVKVLGTGKITIPLIIKVPVSKRAAAKIEKAGGKIEIA